MSVVHITVSEFDYETTSIIFILNLKLNKVGKLSLFEKSKNANIKAHN